jgi:hypothetical protein
MLYCVIYSVHIVCGHGEFESECIITCDVILEHIKIQIICITICRVEQHYYFINIIYILVTVLYNTYKYMFGQRSSSMLKC